ncbi:MAG TPA: type II toxin-antitoxin system HicB family antitoxin [Pseudonocardiaceae bacterium]|nr:type II toxin-antitoxin system HicB family antitoxin [Pseudonocardiaceae bacterium]
MNGYVIIIERADDGGYGAWAPDLPGCVATADDYDTCVAEMREAIRFHLDGMREDGDPIPPDATRAVTISAA